MSKVVRRGDSRYPALLEEIGNPPEKLFYEGDLSLAQEPCAAIVGSRKASEDGLLTAAALGRHAALSGAVVVSGLARGVDSCAQKAALEEGGRVIAVLANGLDVCYPSENRTLQKRIAETGLLLSEYQDGEKARRYYFPIRNRIISGISACTIVVEAGIHSGALQTAEFAVEQGRTVFAAPGSVLSATCAGTNRLIYDGAEMLLTLEDPFRAMGLSRKITKETSSLSTTERRILSLTEGRSEILMEELIAKSGYTASLVTQTVTVLELKGFVATSMGRVYCIRPDTELSL